MNWSGPLTTYGNPPAPRGGHTATFVAKKLFVFGGSAYSAKGLNTGGRESPLTIVKSDLHVLDLGTMTWSIPSVQGIQPPARYAHTGTLMGNKLIIFGGFNGRVYLDDLNVLDTSTMSWYVPVVKGTPPSARYAHTATPVGAKLFIFGGCGENRCFSELHVLDTATMTWYQPNVTGTLPPARAYHTTNLIGRKLFVFGGRAGNKYYNDLHILNLDGMIWTKGISTGTGPIELAYHASSTIDNKLYIFGGMDGIRCYNHCWVLHTESMNWVQHRFEGNAPSSRHKHTCSTLGAQVFIFGGMEAPPVGFSDLYVLDTQPEDKNELGSSMTIERPALTSSAGMVLNNVEEDFSQGVMLDEQVTKLQVECNKLRDDLNQCYIKIDQLCGKNLNGLSMQELDLLEKNYFEGLRRISVYRKEKLQQEYERKLQQQREELEQKVVHIEQREQQTATQLQQRVYVLEQELEKLRVGGENPLSHSNGIQPPNGGNGSGNAVAGGNGGANGLSSSRGVIGDGRNRGVGRRSSVDVIDEPSALEPLLHNTPPGGEPGSQTPIANISLPLPPPGLPGLNLSGSLGLLSGLSNHSNNHHHVNPLSLSMGAAEEDMGVSRFMVERLQGEVTKLQSDNLKLRRKLKDSGVEITEGAPKGNVGFAFVKTREFTPAQGLGVPSTGAAPLGLAFSPLSEDTEELLDGYERRREAERKGVLRIPEDQRKAILMDNGTSEESLEEEARTLNKINWGRLESMASPTENPLPEQQRQVFRKYLFQQ